MTDWHLLKEGHERHVRRLFKDFLYLLEDLQKDHSINFDKLKKSIPESYSGIIDQANYFDGQKMQYLRKRVLDLGNDSIRSSEEDLEKFTVIFKFNH